MHISINKYIELPIPSPLPVDGTDMEPVEEEAYEQYVQIKAVEEVVRHLNHTWQVCSYTYV
jgi:hypothetical protein